MFSESQNNCLNLINFDQIFEKFQNISPEKRQFLISDEPARFTDQGVIDEIHQILPFECVKNSADDLMNLLEITCSEFALQILNKNCYVPPIFEPEPMVRRSLEIR